MSALADFVYLVRCIRRARGTQRIGQYTKIFVLTCNRFVTAVPPTPEVVKSHLSRPIIRRVGVIGVMIVDCATGIIAANAVVTFCSFD